MDFSQAKDYRMPFGQYAGKTLDEIASIDRGFRYLDWLVGETWFHGEARHALEVYLDDPAIKQDLKEMHKED